MQYTLNLPMASGRFEALPPSEYLEIARAAEAAGFDAISVPDNVLFPAKISAPYPYSEDGLRIWDAETPCMDPFVVIPAMAAVTTHIRFYSNVLKLAIREPILVAKTVGSAAVLSGDRVGLGVGLSWMSEEFRFLHQDMRSRGARVDEAIAVIRALLRGGMVEFHGTHYDFDPLQLSPAPRAPVPIYVGGTSQAALRRAARLGDGWLSMIHSEGELAGLIETVLRLHEEAEASRVATTRFEIKVLWPFALRREDVARLAGIGVTDLLVTPWLVDGVDGRRLAAKREALERFADEVVRA
jgi:probable F420-dependent oxidoreductase